MGYPCRQRGPHHPVRARHHRASVTCRLCCSIRLRKVISPSTIISDNSLPKTCHHKLKSFLFFIHSVRKKELDNSDRKFKLGLGQKKITLLTLNSEENAAISKVYKTACG